MRILHIMGSADYGGIPSVAYNFMRYIDRERFHFDFSLNEEPGRIGIQMAELGAKFYKLPFRSHGIHAYREALIQLLKEEQFDAVHVHSGSVSFVDLQVAKKAGIKCRVVHAHTIAQGRTIKDKLRLFAGRILNYHYATTLIACGKEAGDSIYGKLHMRMPKTIVLPNSINTESFSYAPAIRQDVRNELRVSDKYVIGMIGRISPEKNLSFAIDVMDVLRKQITGFVLLVIGDGELRESLEKECHKRGLDQFVHFIGVRTDINRIYQALDVCIMPSLYEGFPVVGIEAIAAGLPVLFSDHITKELSFGKGVQYLPLETEAWVNTLTELPINECREAGHIDVQMHGHDINQTVKKLEKIYGMEILR